MRAALASGLVLMGVLGFMACGDDDDGGNGTADGGGGTDTPDAGESTDGGGTPDAGDDGGTDGGTDPYAACESDGACPGGGECLGIDAQSAFFCAPPCELDLSCPAYGDFEGTCQELGSLGLYCVIECDLADPSCPEGMTCIQAGETSAACLWVDG